MSSVKYGRTDKTAPPHWLWKGAGGGGSGTCAPHDIFCEENGTWIVFGVVWLHCIGGAIQADRSACFLLYLVVPWNPLMPLSSTSHRHVATSHACNGVEAVPRA